jgi:hypothetical protein
MKNPYEALPPKAFWRSAVAEKAPLEIAQLWDPKSNFLPEQRIATMGSCFAQHFGAALTARKYGWFDAEPAPDIFSREVARKYNYGVFSARTGNIYTTAALRQWVHWALGREPVPAEVWETDGRFFDPFRPAIEPGGFASAEELQASREAVLAALRRIIHESDVFVFTLGLTEGWLNAEHGYNYAMCPGTLAGTFDPALHRFHNYGFPEVLADLTAALDAIRSENPRIRFLLTVSPVPLTATASGKHVLTATTYSKSVLRAVAGSYAETRDDVDYFPSYEIITAPAFGGMFYDANKRTVKAAGVNFVMQSFFAALAEKFGDQAASPAPERVAKPAPEQVRQEAPEEDGVVCEEQMLEAFAG